MAVGWYVRTDAGVQGPLSISGLKRLTMEGEVTPAALIRRGADGPWLEAWKLQDIFDDLPVRGETLPPEHPPAVNDEVVADWLSEPDTKQRTPSGTQRRPTPDPSCGERQAQAVATGEVARPAFRSATKAPPTRPPGALDHSRPAVGRPIRLTAIPWEFGVAVVGAVVIGGVLFWQNHTGHLETEAELRQKIAILEKQQSVARTDPDDEPRTQAAAQKDAAKQAAKREAEQQAAAKLAAEKAAFLRYQRPTTTLSKEQAEQLANELKGELTAAERSAVAKFVSESLLVGEKKLNSVELCRLLVRACRAVIKRRNDLKVASLDDPEAARVFASLDKVAEARPPED